MLAILQALTAAPRPALPPQTDPASTSRSPLNHLQQIPIFKPKAHQSSDSAHLQKHVPATATAEPGPNHRANMSMASKNVQHEQVKQINCSSMQPAARHQQPGQSNQSIARPVSPDNVFDEAAVAAAAAASKPAQSGAMWPSISTRKGGDPGRLERVAAELLA